MMAAELVQISAGMGLRVRRLREGRGWTIADAAQRVELTAEVWEAFEQGGGAVVADAYRRIIAVFGFTESSMAFIENAGRQGTWPS